MLFGYPVAATAENWLHDGVVAGVRQIHELVANDQQLPVWPELLPAVCRERLAARHGLRDRLVDYARALRALTPNERQIVLEALESQNRIADLINRHCDCMALSELPEQIREPIKALFTFTFELLTDFEIRQRQYEVVCEGIPARVCPFCGCESLEAPGAPQEDLDHYLPRLKYPFSAANLRNLAPMGGRCNKAYKRTQDPLRRDSGERRLSRDPYDATGVSVSLDNSVVDELTAGPAISEWVIEFFPTDEAIETWEKIFHIRERWIRDVLDPATFKQWLRDFRSFCIVSAHQIAGDADLVAAVGRYEQHLASCGVADRAFLKAAVFRFLSRRCALGCQRLLPILRDLTGVPQPPALIAAN